MAESFHLDEAEQAELLSLARKSVTAQAARSTLPEPEAGELAGSLSAHAGCFVTLHRRSDQELRGCVGTFSDDRPLADAVVEMAAASSSRDPRFPPVQPAEVPGLEIEISVLSPPEPVSSPKQIEIGTHGIRVRSGRRTGVLLPQVATRYGWGAEEFLGATCKKAGLPLTSWKSGNVEVEVFSTCTFHD